jgi:hypothetical protein
MLSRRDRSGGLGLSGNNWHLQAVFIKVRSGRIIFWPSADQDGASLPLTHDFSVGCEAALYIIIIISLRVMPKLR